MSVPLGTLKKVLGYCVLVIRDLAWRIHTSYFTRPKSIRFPVLGKEVLKPFDTWVDKWLEDNGPWKLSGALASTKEKYASCIDVKV